MLKPVSKLPTCPNLSRWFHVSANQFRALKEKTAPVRRQQAGQTGREVGEKEYSQNEKDALVRRQVKRNELGVQLLPRKLHTQIFRNVSFPVPDPSFVQISKEHLEMHGLDPTQGSVLPDTAFQLPPMQGSNLAEHFHRIGAQVAEPWLHIAKTFASSELPPKPDHWDLQAGWTKYNFLPDGSSYSEHVEYPIHEGKAEQMLTFDVETMPKYHPFAVMACAASKNAWYAWISPWILGESDVTQHLIPLGDPKLPKVVVGHNVSYDRGRILEEYSLESTQFRFLDTMAFHISVKGISSHQRPAWMKHRKQKETELQQQQEAIEAVVELISGVEQLLREEVDETKKEELRRLHTEMERSLMRLQDVDEEIIDADVTNDVDVVSKRWEDLTSANSLADVAKLHCDITMDKQVRNDFMELTPSEIQENITEYLDYCAEDVNVTHRVYSTVLPLFLQACPHPVSFAGILTMGSSFLPVNQEWQKYIQRAEAVYQDMEAGVQRKLKKLAEDARLLMGGEKWKENVWLSQLDWTPKVAGKSRGIFPAEVKPEPMPEVVKPPAVIRNAAHRVEIPAWYQQVMSDPVGSVIDRMGPLLLEISYNGYPLRRTYKDGWYYLENDDICSLEPTGKAIHTLLGPRHFLMVMDHGTVTSRDIQLAKDLSRRGNREACRERVIELANRILQETDESKVSDNPWLFQLDWTSVKNVDLNAKVEPFAKPKRIAKPKVVKPDPILWPKWYWDATKPRKGEPPGSLEITVRNRIAPLLFHLSWLGWPLFYSREHGWTFRVSANAKFTTRSSSLTFYDPADDSLAEFSLKGGYVFYKLPHKDGEKANVGSPLSKSFMKFAQDGTLKSPGEEAKEALDLNAQCSYWISARDRIMNQTVVWQEGKTDLGFRVLAKPDAEEQEKWGIILPQVITMGTVTRRAIEKTWLTASNAKANRVGSELKAMVRAPKGYAIVGADVDSEELWISSCMGDAQFGLHGATAIGWMTLEGTKAAGTDLHSKTAGILGISRDQAKVFNYSRIYGAGMRHAILLLLQSNAGMLQDQAQKLAENLYASTKGKNTHRSDIFDRKFWFGGSESYLFNKLEEIALSDRPQTPALGCGVTYALSKEYLPEGFGFDYMPSRINWVVQSSGVDYLHMLIVSMDYLITKYDIKARYLISVHDELRYLVTEEDKYRASLALQIANLWTRSMFAYKLGMDDLPQGVAFFSAVDVDTVLRKEVFMSCVTPSQPIPIPAGESLDIAGVLQKTNGGTLWRDGRPMVAIEDMPYAGTLEGYEEPNCLTHRASSAAFLRAQATKDFGEVKGLATRVTGKRFDDVLKHSKVKKNTKAKVKTPLGDGDGYDWSETVERLLRQEQ